MLRIGKFRRVRFRDSKNHVFIGEFCVSTRLTRFDLVTKWMRANRLVLSRTTLVTRSVRDTKRFYGNRLEFLFGFAKRSNQPRYCHLAEPSSRLRGEVKRKKSSMHHEKKKKNTFTSVS